MMNYKLAKQLKDAGFPQRSKGGFMSAYDKEKGITSCIVEKGAELAFHYKIPTLSELIEACGDGFVALTHFDTLNPSAWKAEQHIKGVNFGILEEQGKTSEEAVAKLWLTLNK